MATFKNISGRDLIIPDVGIVKAGETVELPDTFRNGNFERVKIVDSSPRAKSLPENKEAE